MRAIVSVYLSEARVSVTTPNVKRFIMALKKCKECDKEVSTKADKCPNCGAPIKKHSTVGNFLVLILFVVIIGGLIGTCFESDSTKTKKPQASSPRKPVVEEEEKIIEVRTCLKEAIKTIDVIKGTNGKVTKVLEGIEAINIRTGPGMNYRQDESGPLWKEDKLYVLEEKTGWIRFRVTPKDFGWSAWIKKDLTIFFSPSPEEVRAKRITKFGEPPEKSSWDGSVECVKEYLESAVNDPDSLKYDFWSEVYFSDDGWLVKCEFRAKNLLGAYVRDTKWFVIQHGHVVDVRESPQPQSDVEREKEFDIGQLDAQKRYEATQFAMLSKLKQAQVLYMKKWLEEAKPEDIGKLNEIQKELIREVALLRRIAEPLMEEHTRMMLQDK